MRISARISSICASLHHTHRHCSSTSSALHLDSQITPAQTDPPLRPALARRPQRRHRQIADSGTGRRRHRACVPSPECPRWRGVTLRCRTHHGQCILSPLTLTPTPTPTLTLLAHMHRRPSHRLLMATTRTAAGQPRLVTKFRRRRHGQRLVGGVVRLQRLHPLVRAGYLLLQQTRGGHPSPVLNASIRTTCLPHTPLMPLMHLPSCHQMIVLRPHQPSVPQSVIKLPSRRRPSSRHLAIQACLHPLL